MNMIIKATGLKGEELAFNPINVVMVATDNQTTNIVTVEDVYEVAEPQKVIEERLSEALENMCKRRYV